jgi:ParB-like chromosome segregation protein Spo0J
MRLRSVKPGDIKVPDIRVTSRFDSEALDEFKQSVKALGVLDPPLCMEVEGDLWVVDGLHRIIEAINNRVPHIQVYVMEGAAAKDVLLKNIAMLNRGKSPASELAKAFEELQREHHMDTGDIATQAGISRDRVEKLIWIGRAGPAILEALDQELINVGHAFAIARIPDPEVQKTVLAQQLMYRWKVADLEEHIRNVLDIKRQLVESPPPPAPAAKPLFKCSYCGQEYEASMVQNPNTCAACAGILIQAHRSAQWELEEERRQREVAAQEAADRAEPQSAD